MQKLKVLHLPTDVGGNSYGLSNAEREMGLDSRVLVSQTSRFGYPADYQMNLAPNQFLRNQLKKLRVFFEIRNRYDVFHFNGGSSLFMGGLNPLFAHLDIPFYPKKAKLFVTYNGCDARQKYPTMKRTCMAACHERECYGGMCNSGDQDKLRAVRIEKMAQYVEHMWAVNPDLLYFLPKEKASFLPYSICHFNPQKPSILKGQKLKIVHAPTNHAGKGSRYIIAAVEKLQEKYPNAIEFRLVENLPHQEALAIYSGADLVIDQILIGWYGAFAVETMLMGKPVICRIAVDDLHFIPTQMADQLNNTIINSDPSNIYAVLEQCLHNRDFLLQRAQASVDYANQWHHPRYVASICKDKYI